MRIAYVSLPERGQTDAAIRAAAALLSARGLRLAADRLAYLSHWITQAGRPRRYDTRFFVAAAPEEQVALHDDREVIGTRWLTPRDALADHEAGRMTMIFPTVRTMVALGRFDSSAEVLEHARAQADVPAVLPMLRDEGGGLRLSLPGDPEGTGGVYDAISGEPL
jgi:hypothetical protein